MPDPRYRTINIDTETFDKLSALAARGYRSVPAEIRYLVDRELGQQELAEARQVVGDDAALRLLAGDTEPCPEATK